MESLLGYSTKARTELGWEPEITIDQMIEEMVQKDLKIARKEQLLIDNGYSSYTYED